MKNLVLYSKGVSHFFAKEGFLTNAEQLIRECDTIEEAKEIANHLNKVLNGGRVPFNGYSVVYGKGVECFSVIEGDKVNDSELLIESFETEEEAFDKRNQLNKMNDLRLS